MQYDFPFKVTIDQYGRESTTQSTIQPKDTNLNHIPIFIDGSVSEISINPYSDENNHVIRSGIQFNQTELKNYQFMGNEIQVRVFEGNYDFTFNNPGMSYDRVSTVTAYYDLFSGLLLWKKEFHVITNCLPECDFIGEESYEIEELVETNQVVGSK